MTCRPMFCEGRADCGDKHCPGHPVNSDAALDQRMREAEGAQDEPLTDPAYMLTLAAVWGVVAVAVIVGAIGWFAYFVWPVVAAYINR